MDILISYENPLTIDATELLSKLEEEDFTPDKLSKPLFPITDDNKDGILFFYQVIYLIADTTNKYYIFGALYQLITQIDDYMDMYINYGESDKFQYNFSRLSDINISHIEQRRNNDIFYTFNIDNKKIKVCFGKERTQFKNIPIINLLYIFIKFFDILDSTVTSHEIKVPYSMKELITTINETLNETLKKKNEKMKALTAEEAEAVKAADEMSYEDTREAVNPTSLAIFFFSFVGYKKTQMRWDISFKLKDDKEVKAVNLVENCDNIDHTNLHDHLNNIFPGIQVPPSQPINTLFPYCSEVPKLPIDYVNEPTIAMSTIDILKKKFNVTINYDKYNQNGLTIKTNKIIRRNTQYIESAPNSPMKFLELLKTDNTGERNKFIVSHDNFMYKLYNFIVAKYFTVNRQLLYPETFFDNLDILHIILDQDGNIKKMMVRRFAHSYGLIIDNTSNPYNSGTDASVIIMRHCYSCHNAKKDVLEKITKGATGMYNLGYFKLTHCFAYTLNEMREKREHLIKLLNNYGDGIQNYSFGSSVIFRAILTSILQLYVLLTPPEAQPADTAAEAAEAAGAAEAQPAQPAEAAEAAGAAEAVEAQAPEGQAAEAQAQEPEAQEPEAAPKAPPKAPQSKPQSKLKSELKSELKIQRELNKQRLDWYDYGFGGRSKRKRVANNKNSKKKKKKTRKRLKKKKTRKRVKIHKR